MILQESAKLCVLSGLVPSVPPAICALMSHVSWALHALVSYVPCVLRVLLPHSPCALHVLVPHVTRATRASWITCLVSYLSSCLVLYEPLRTLSCFTLLTLCPNITFRALLMKHRMRYLDG